MLDENAPIIRSNNDNAKENYRRHSADMDQKYIVQWSSPDENKCFFKNRYISASKSVPRRSKQFVRYKISRSLNFDVFNIQNSSSENSSVDGEKYLSRSAKIMKALNFTNSPPYYSRTKIKRSLNFNLTPSPKTFPRTSKNMRKVSSLSFATSSPKLSKVLNYDDSPSSSANSSLVFAVSDSIDENQNETPSQQRVKARQSLSYSTPDSKPNKKSPELSTFTPYLRSTLKEKINNIIYVTTTPNQPSVKCKGRLKYSDDVVVGTPRNLLHDFHNEETGRPTTPENIIRLVPESMSAIKRSHKKERSSRWGERSMKDSMKRTSSEMNAQDIADLDDVSPIVVSSLQKSRKPSSIGKLLNKGKNRKYETSLRSSASEENLSDTGSIFDYKEEQERIWLEDADVSNLSVDCDSLQVDNHDLSEELDDSIKLQLEESIQSPDNESNKETSMSEVVIKGTSAENKLMEPEEESGTKTPEPTGMTSVPSPKPITPENRINYLQHVLQDSIKRSHKKIKEDRKKKLFSPKLLLGKMENTEKATDFNIQDEEQYQPTNEALNNTSTEKDNDIPESTQRASTPEKVNSSRLLLSQFSSIKKSHKKDKNNKILSRFKKRQEYFNRDLDLPAEQGEGMHLKKGATDELKDKKGPLDTSVKEMSEGITNLNDICLEKLSPSKRKKSSLDSSLDPNVSGVSCDSELQGCDSEIEDFQIFTPLKRKKAGKTPIKKEYFCFYSLPSGKEDISEESLTEVNLSRCLTPIVSFRKYSTKSKDASMEKTGVNDAIEEINVSSVEVQSNNSNDRNATGGRSTPRNMSTTELYPNVDSIKKSHKKNKRSNRLRRRMNLEESGALEASVGEPSSKKSENQHPNSSSDSIELCLRDDDVFMENVCKSNAESSGSHNSNKNSENENEEPSVEEVAPIKTPPNCLKTKSYITRIQNTSIKRSHKKVRDKKKHEIQLDVHDLSDEGSIFGDEERLASLELDEPSLDSKKHSGLLSKSKTFNS